MLKRIRISTLMLLIVIAALIVGLVVEKRRSTAILAQMQAERDNARILAAQAEYVATIERATSLLLEAKPKIDGSNPNPSASPPR
jgi:hypothetical protein